MQYTFVSGSQGSSPRLILIFSGWGMDPHPFSGLRRPGYDIAVVWDYRSLDFPAYITEGYDEICVVAWSMGVLAASASAAHFSRRLTLSVAVNGTMHPVDDRLGIPVAIFNATLENLTERSLEKFRMRMCGGARNYASFMETAPRRPLDELKDELRVLGRLAEDGLADERIWDHAVISDGDAIFPPASQKAAWADRTRSVSIVRGCHIPDFQELIDHFVMNKAVVERRFERSNATYGDNAVVQREIADELAGLIARNFSSPTPVMLEIGCGTGMLSTPLLALADRLGGSLELWDIVDSRPIAGAAFRCADAETAIRELPDSSCSLIASASTIQWFNSPVKFIREAMRCLKPGGMLAISTFATGNLVEVAQATGCFLPLIAEHEWRKAIEGLGDIIASHTRRKILRFTDPVKVFRHLKSTGVNALSAKESLLRSLDRYPREADGACHLTYLPIFIVLRKK